MNVSKIHTDKYYGIWIRYYRYDILQKSIKFCMKLHGKRLKRLNLRNYSLFIEIWENYEDMIICGSEYITKISWKQRSGF